MVATGTGHTQKKLIQQRYQLCVAKTLLPDQLESLQSAGITRRFECCAAGVVSPDRCDRLTIGFQLIIRVGAQMSDRV
jgi:hypothetical protein